jgi:hypothetical protein
MNQTKLVFLKKQVGEVGGGGWQLEIDWVWYLDDPRWI